MVDVRLGGVQVVLLLAVVLEAVGVAAKPVVPAHHVLQSKMIPWTPIRRASAVGVALPVAVDAACG